MHVHVPCENLSMQCCLHEKYYSTQADKTYPALEQVPWCHEAVFMPTAIPFLQWLWSASIKVNSLVAEVEDISRHHGGLAKAGMKGTVRRGAHCENFRNFEESHHDSANAIKTCYTLRDIVPLCCADLQKACNILIAKRAWLFKGTQKMSALLIDLKLGQTRLLNKNKKLQKPKRKVCAEKKWPSLQGHRHRRACAVQTLLYSFASFKLLLVFS
jgi:hypothetical protein